MRVVLHKSNLTVRTRFHLHNWPHRSRAKTI